MKNAGVCPAFFMVLVVFGLKWALAQVLAALAAIEIVAVCFGLVLVRGFVFFAWLCWPGVARRQLMKAVGSLRIQ